MTCSTGLSVHSWFMWAARMDGKYERMCHMTGCDYTQIADVVSPIDLKDEGDLMEKRHLRCDHKDWGPWHWGDVGAKYYRMCKVPGCQLHQSATELDPSDPVTQREQRIILP